MLTYVADCQGPVLLHHPMSKRGDPVRVVEQLDLGGGISVIELHGLGGRTRANVLRCKTARAVADAIRASVDLNESTLVASAGGELERPCPRCGGEGDAAEVFGFRVVRGHRLRQSWCRRCRSTRGPGFAVKG